jgi:hypothetical protein
MSEIRRLQRQPEDATCHADKDPRNMRVYFSGSHCNSVSIQTRPRVGWSRFGSRQGQRFLSLLHCVTISFEAHSVSYPMCTGSLVPEVERPERAVYQSYHSSAEVNNTWSGAIPPLLHTPADHGARSGLTLTLLFIIILSTNKQTNQLTPWSWVLLEKPPVSQILKNFPTSYGTRRFITVFTRALYCRFA